MDEVGFVNQMGFWIFMLSMDLLIPITMIGFGKLFSQSTLKTINPVIGYRTTMSMKNEETWAFAHQYIGRIWYKAGWVTLFITGIIMLFFMGKDNDTIGNIGAILCMVQMVPLIVPIFFTERALKKEFDKEGRRRM